MQWSHLIGWPTNLAEAQRLKLRIRSVMALVNGLQAPIRATLMALNPEPTYGPGRERAVDFLPPRLQHRI